MDDVVAWLRERAPDDGTLCLDRTVSGRAAATQVIDLESRLAGALADRGIKELYDHQARAIEAVRNGRDVVVATPTASGKSLVYTVPAVERALDHGGRTLYIGPQNALIADQLQSLSGLAEDLGFGSRVRVDEYTGRLDDDERAAVRDRQPTVLLTNPDMLHYGILPHGHRLWDWFLSGLETVVLDEIHAYRGIFGAGVGLTLRRLFRLCERFDAAPDVICCSATIGNPVVHAARLTARDRASFRLVDTSTAGTGPKRWLAWNPPLHEGGEGQGRRRSSHVESRRIAHRLIANGHQTLVFTRARQAAERYATETAEKLRHEGHADLADRVTAYQAALPDDRRREIEAGLSSGSIRGVWATNALELGVDVGGLDAVVLDGYPGTRTATFQRAGRAGRGDDPALVVLVAGEDQLDQFIASNPDRLFAGPPEDAVLDPTNEELLPDHIRCAARENWLRPADESRFGPTFPDIVASLTAAGQLGRRQTDSGIRWTETGGAPHQEISLRGGTGQEVQLRSERTGERLASLSVDDAIRDAHPGAIYHHQDRTYEVTTLDLEARVAELSPTWADYHTRVLTEKTVTVDQEFETVHPLAGTDVPVTRALVTVQETVTGFQRRDDQTGAVLGEESVSLPPRELTTEALFWTIPEDAERARMTAGDLPGAIHAAEHGAISLLPTRLLCDRGDVGGLSTPRHGHTGRPTIFIYDGYPGGVGITRAAFKEIADLMADTHAMLTSCDCQDGCPACVQSPQCGNANEPLTRTGAAALLGDLLGGK